MSALDWAVPLLRCPVCGGGLALRRDTAEEEQGLLVHSDCACTEAYPVIDGVPRLLVGEARAPIVRERRPWFDAAPARRAIAAQWSGRAAGDPVVRAFDAEWSRFDTAGSAELRTIFGMYFDLVPRARISSGQIVLDAGCGAGRWAVELAARGPRVLAVDLGASVDAAHRNAAGSDRIACVQGDLRSLPVADAGVDWACSLGVLHHLESPAPALEHVVRAVRPGGLVLIYLYYALDRRGPAFRAVFRSVDTLRRLTSRLPRGPLVVLTTAIAVLVYWPLARASAALARAGLVRLAEALPLSFYRDRSLRIMRNDSLDRFGTSIEQRYTRERMAALMRSVGLSDVRFSDGPPYWHATGVRGR